MDKVLADIVRFICDISNSQTFDRLAEETGRRLSNDELEAFVGFAQLMQKGGSEC